MITATPDDATLYIARADVEREMKHEDLALVDLEEAIGWMLPRLMLICCVGIST